jgi:hypothetical protein
MARRFHSLGDFHKLATALNRAGDLADLGASHLRRHLEQRVVAGIEASVAA